MAAREPRNWRVQRSLGLVYRVLGRADESIRALQLARDFSGRLPTANADLVNALIRTHRHTEAENILAEALATQTSGRLLTFDLMLRTQWRGDLPAAMAALEKWPDWLLSEDRGAILAWRTWLWSGNHDKALLVLRRLPHDYLRDTFFTGPRAVLTARAHEAAGHTEVARADWQTVVQVANRELTTAPADIYASYWKAWALARLGDTAGAQAICVQMQQRGQLALSEEDRDKAVARYFGGPGAAPLWATVGRADLALAELNATPVVGNLFAVTRAMVNMDPAFLMLRTEAGFEIALAKLPAPTKPTPDLSAVVATKADPKSVAVLAFINQSDDKANEYISDGLADELQMVLKKIPGLRVAAQTSAFSFKGKNATAKEVGEKLGMAHVVSGTVLKSGNRIKITARLNHAATNEEIWLQSFGPLELTDLFATQSEIAQQIVAGLRGLLTGETVTTPAAAAAQAEIKAQVQAATKGGTKNSEAHQLYLQGKFLVNQHTVESAIRAAASLRRAVDLDPQFALAWAALSEAGRVRSGFGDTKLDFDEGLKVAREAADRAVALGPELVTALLVQENLLRTYDFDWKRAAELLQRAKALAPSDPAVLTQSSELAFAKGQVERAVELGKEATALDPINPRLLMNLGYALTELGRYDEARAEFQRIIELSPTAPWGYSGIGLMLTAQGKAAEAIDAAAKVATKWERLYVLAIAEWARGNKAASDAALNEMIASVADIAAVQIAWAYAYRRETDRAFEWLDRAYRQHDGGLAWTKPNFALKSLHSDPRWPAFWKKFGLADDQLK